ncbi:L-serine dehydratase [Bacilli bacterium]|nr:L-serine dehydratase [Bacilli bacterium]
MISVFDIFKVCIGPSSSHTVGPMKAAMFFVEEIQKQNYMGAVNKINVDLYGSLALTRTGHGTDIAIQLGLEGFNPKSIDTSKVNGIIRNIKTSGKLKILNKKSIEFSGIKNIITHKTKELPYHPNGMIITAFDVNGNILYSEEYYSVGGGFVEKKSDILLKNIVDLSGKTKFPYNFNSWNDLMNCCKRRNKEIWEVVLANEKVTLNEKRINEKIAEIYDVMGGCIENGSHKKGKLKGGLGLKRRSRNLARSLKKNPCDHLRAIDNLLMGGIAASEENASYGRIVSAPTNGAAGVIPAVVRYWRDFYDATFEDFRKFIFTAGAVGILCKINASISGAEGGCQAEIGTATAMAAAGLCAALGGTEKQCENAAIIALTHNLGLVCDPIKGLVQIPCIERNPINSIKAVSACRLAMLEKESVYLKLDKVIRTMKEIGDNMPSIYKETALGGLATNAKNSKCRKTMAKYDVKYGMKFGCGACAACAAV